MAAERIFDVNQGSTGDGWRAVECTRVNVDPDTKLAHANLGETGVIRQYEKQFRKYSLPT